MDFSSLPKITKSQVFELIFRGRKTLPLCEQKYLQRNSVFRYTEEITIIRYRDPKSRTSRI